MQSIPPTSQPQSWYEVVSGDDLQQGDLIRSCPAFELPKDFVVEEPLAAVEVVPVLWDVAVLTQSCDLANKDLESVLVCPYRPISKTDELIPEEHRKTEKGRNSFFEQVRRGSFHSLHMLNACDLEGLQQEVLILDFRRVFSLPSPLLVNRAQHNQRRLRLLSPYREHLAQGFARFFMRVGLPSDIPRFR